MRRYDPDGVLGSMDEVFRIGREAGVPVHISHFNSRAGLVLPKIDAGRADGIDVTYDLYCYFGREHDPGHGCAAAGNPGRGRLEDLGDSFATPRFADSYATGFPNPVCR